MSNYQTLHSHTTSSDGKLTHLDLLKQCYVRNIGTVAITDHDTLLTSKKIKELNNFSKNIKWISGIEISSGWPLDLGGGATSGLHVTGLFVNPENKELLSHCKKAKEARIDRMSKIVKNLNNLGFSISQQDCLKASSGESVGRPHIVEALTYNKENLLVYESLKEKMRIDAENNKELYDKYNYMLERGGTQDPYILFLSEDAYIKNIYVDYPYYSDFDNTVSMIRSAGGLAFIAHWATCRGKMDDDYIDKLLREDRIDGMEIVYGLWNYNTAKWTEQEKELEIIKKLVKKNNKLKSGGADAHTIEDLEKFITEKWYSNQTINLVEEIIKSSKVDTTWSSFR